MKEGSSGILTWYTQLMPFEHSHPLFIDGKSRRRWYESFEDQEFATWLEQKGFRFPIAECGRGVYRAIQTKPLFPQHHLPAGVWYKGGCARACLQARMGLPVAQPRDVDLFLDTAVALKHPDTYALPLQKPDDLEISRPYPWHAQADEEEEEDTVSFFEYFCTRDFFVNEVLANDRELFFTKEAFISLWSKELLCTPIEWNKVASSYAQQAKLLAKSFQFQLRWMQHDPHHTWKIDTRLLEGLPQETLDCYSFYPLLFLDRLLAQDERLGHQYLLLWQESGYFQEIGGTFEFFVRLYKNTRRDYRPESDYAKRYWNEIQESISLLDAEHEAK